MVDYNLVSALVGLILSDGYLNRNNKNSDYRMSFTFKVWDKERNCSMMEFNNWLKFEVLKKICTSKELNLYPKDKPRQCTFNTKNWDWFTSIYPNFYNTINDKTIKIIPNKVFLQCYFTSRSLAFMIMGDGYWDKEQQTVYICTECFKLEDLHNLIYILRHKLKLVVTTKKRNNGFRLRFSSKKLNIKLLREITQEHFHPLMLYRLGL